MKKIIAIAVFGIFLGGCASTQTQIEGATPAVVTGVEHSHKVENYGDHKHTHSGDNSESHGHSWNYIQNEIKK